MTAKELKLTIKLLLIAINVNQVTIDAYADAVADTETADAISGMQATNEHLARQVEKYKLELAAITLRNLTPTRPLHTYIGAEDKRCHIVLIADRVITFYQDTRNGMQHKIEQPISAMPLAAYYQEIERRTTWIAQ